MTSNSGAFGADVRYRTWLIGLVVLIVLAVPFLFSRGVVFFGESSIQGHAVSKARQEIQQRFNEGVVMLHAKQYDHAITAFHRVLQINPKMPEAHVNMGFALLGAGKPKAAADFFDTATILKPDQMNAYYGLGEALEQMGEKLGALQAMETYLHRSPKDDPFRVKAEAAVWELRAALAAEKAKSVDSKATKQASKGNAK